MTAVRLLKAAPHQWGSGQIHELQEDDKTLCGQTPARCPGQKFEGVPGQVTCKACLRSRQSRLDAEARHAQWEAERREYEERNRWWWVEYDDYLQTAEWGRRRKLVFRRAKGICEACLREPAVMVHHLRYPKNCIPGSEQWLRREKMFDLVAICQDCHDDVHEEI